MDLRKQFFSVMDELASKDEKVIVLTGDLGHSFYEEYAEKHPKQFLNMGIAEQNMVGVAAGMALGGLKPYCYSGTNFLLFRALEQIRNDVAYNGLDVKICGTGASPFLGFSHNLMPGESERNILAGIPIQQFYPQNEEELRQALTSNGGAFIRI